MVLGKLLQPPKELAADKPKRTFGFKTGGFKAR